MEKATQKNKINEEERLGKIKDPNLKEIFLILTSNKMLNSSKIKLNEEIESNLKQEVKEIFKDKIQEINEKFSELRKEGKDLGVLNFKLMMLPLKFKVFLSSYEKRDLENILKRIQEIEEEINKLNK
jgi:hypothetical protein